MSRVVFLQDTGKYRHCRGAGATRLLALLGFWLAYPLWRRVRHAALMKPPLKHHSQRCITPPAGNMKPELKPHIGLK
jgi:hypothetical protein